MTCILNWWHDFLFFHSVLLCYRWHFLCKTNELVLMSTITFSFMYFFRISRTKLSFLCAFSYVFLITHLLYSYILHAYPHTLCNGCCLNKKATVKENKKINNAFSRIAITFDQQKRKKSSASHHSLTIDIKRRFLIIHDTTCHGITYKRWLWFYVFALQKRVLL